MAIELELLAPARDKATALAAISHGADAVYIGAPSHSARAAAGCSVADIAEVAVAAHRFKARVYVALNTLVYDSETADVERMIWELYRAGADALIVQDMGITAMNLPPIALHASTQTDIRSPRRAAELAALGMTRIVVARELSLAETAEIHRELPGMEIEAFVHGALCVSYSGDCRASFAATGRSANRGECSQMCRHSYTLHDGSGNVLVADKKLLSLRDLNRSSRLAEMAGAGVTSFKIEGRLKDEAYVKETVGYYSQLLDLLVEKSGGRYCRASVGRTELTFVPDPAKAFNRGFTQYFTTGVPPKGMPVRMATIDAAGAAGEEIGNVAAILPKGGVKLNLAEGISLSAGDGLSYTAPDGTVEGFRVNRVEGSVVYLAPGAEAPVRGTRLKRTRDAARERVLAREDTATRVIPVNISLRINQSGRITAEAEDKERGLTVSVASPDSFTDKASATQKGRRKGVFEKLGNTIYRLAGFSDLVPDDIFIPASALTALRRDLMATLDDAAAATYRFPVAGKRIEGAVNSGANIANRFARSLSPDGLESAETQHPGGKGMEGERVMTTRYCLRRELGHCLSTAPGREWRGPLTLTDAAGNSFRADFDCAACMMHIIWLGRRNR
ncbi:MAG: U32 family peptidase [Bacteroides sp.]|nr:U32 family peptidase [Bacteroides sp.]